MAKRGLFIAIEGGDGTGKATQAELLRKYFNEELKKDVFKTSFPRYGEKSAHYASQYLNGVYGSADQVSGDLAGLTYAIDRFAGKKDIENTLKNSGIVIADRYVASNLAHQGTKFKTDKEREEYYERAFYLEYEILGIPRPDINIVLLMSAEMMQLNVDKKEVRSYTDKKRDIHEADASHLSRASLNYEELCRLYPDDFISIQCIDKDNNLKSIEEIQKQIQKIIKDITPNWSL